MIVFATLSALLWALIRIPGAGGPDEADHLVLIDRIRDAGGIPLFEGFEPTDFMGSPGRVINAFELTPNVSALALAGLASAARLGDAPSTLLLGRLYAVSLFPATLLLAYLTLRLLIPSRPVERVWALTALATIPQFMLVHSYLTNDTPTIAAASLAIYLTVRGWTNGFRRRDAVLLGVALGLVGLHKANGLIVAPMAGALIAWRLRHNLPHMFRTLGAVAIPALAVAGWWYVRMLVEYGEPFGTATTRAAVEAVGTAVETPQAQGLSPWEYAHASGWLEGTFRSFWAGYGVRKMTIPDPAYFVLLAMLIVGAAGLMAGVVRSLTRNSRNGPVWVAFGLTLASLWGLNLWTSWSLDGAAMHGRYTFPAMIPFVALLAVGVGRALAVTGRGPAVLALTIPLMVASSTAYSVHVVVRDVVGLHA